MLHESSVESVFILAKKAAAAGLSLSPKAGSPLAMAVSEIYSPQLDTTDATDPYMVSQQLVFASKRETPGGFPHDDAIETLAAMGAAAIQRTIHIARNEVNSKVTQVITDVETALSGAALSAVNPVAIVPQTLGGVWTSTTLRALAESYELIPAASVRMPTFFPARTEDEVMALIKTGTARFDAELAEWANILGGAWFQDVYRKSFEKTNLSGEFVDSMDRQFDMIVGYETPEEGRNALLAIFIMSMSLREDAPEESGVDLTTFRKVLRDVTEQAGRIIMREFEKYATDSKSNTLLRSWPSSDQRTLLTPGRIIAVNGDVYTRWLSEGGSPEILLGSYVSDKNTGYTHLITNGERYAQEWKRVMMMLRSQINSQRFNTVIQTMSKSISAIIAAVPEAELVVQSRAVFHSRLQEKLREVSISDIENLYPLIRKLVCHSMYAHTQAEQVLAAIDQIMAQQPNLEAREAALYAVIDLVGDWVYSLMDVRIGVQSDATECAMRTGLILTTLANGVELGANIIEKCAGNDISNKTEMFSARVQDLAPIIAVKLQSKLQSLIG